MKPIEDLKMEHQAVKITLSVLDSIVNEAEKTKKVKNPDHLNQLIEFFRTFVDKCHHSKEEALLFPALEKVGVSNEDGPIGIMLKEHQLGRDYVAKMEAALARYNDGEEDAVQDLINNGRGYISLLNQHIHKEDNVLFPIAETHLSKSTQKELWKGFETIEIEKIGEGKHEEFHKMIESLDDIYNH